MKYSEVLIYYFTGTGNSENVANWFCKKAEESGIECNIINIAEADRQNIKPPDNNTLIVFTSPIHGFNYPPVMLNFIRRFPGGKNNIALMNTRAGMKIGKWVTPGLTGIAFYLSALILKVKGYSIVGFKPVDLPSNWISLHPGLNDNTVKYLHEVNKKRVTDFAEKILAGKKHFRCLWEIVQDIAISPIALGYYLIGRFMLAKTYFASANCNGCDICLKKCPVQAIIKVNDRPFWTLNCESCMRCMSNCPEKAIETAHGFFTLTLLLFYNVILMLVYSYLDVSTLLFNNGLLVFIFRGAFMIFIFTLSYRMFHFLLRFRFFERFFVYTSLTKYKFWGRRYKALK